MELINCLREFLEWRPESPLDACLSTNSMDPYKEAKES